MSKLASTPNIFSSFKKTIENSGSTIFNSVLVVVTISGEASFSSLAFNCPCSFPQNRYYGGAFLFLPASILFLVGVFISSTTWKILHGCCYRHKATSHGFKRSMYYWFSVFAQASVAPMAWLFVGFLNGEYYTCYQAAEVEACHFSNGTMVPGCICNLPLLEKKHLQATSQMIGWIILLVAVAAALFVKMFSSCMDRFTYQQNYYFELYRKIEEEKFHEIAKETATKCAVENSHTFFNKTDRTKFDWDTVSEVPKSDYPHFLSEETLGVKPDPFYSPLQRWAHYEKTPEGNNSDVDPRGSKRVPTVNVQPMTPVEE